MAANISCSESESTGLQLVFAEDVLANEVA